jgi:ATP-dependent Lon protease
MAREQPNRPRIIEQEDGGIVVQPGAVEQKPKTPREVEIPQVAAVLCVRNMVLFPGTIIPIAIGREKSRRLLEDVLPEQKVIVIVCQRKPDIDDPAPSDLFDVGTAAVVLKLLRMEEGGQSVIVSGLKRIRVEQWVQSEPYFRARTR